MLDEFLLGEIRCQPLLSIFTFISRKHVASAQFSFLPHRVQTYELAIPDRSYGPLCLRCHGINLGEEAQKTREHQVRDLVGVIGGK
jgi:hypothetical protein